MMTADGEPECLLRNGFARRCGTRARAKGSYENHESSMVDVSLGYARRPADGQRPAGDRRVCTSECRPVDRKAKTVRNRIEGMTCAACAKGLEASFRNMAGVVKADVDYKA